MDTYSIKDFRQIDITRYEDKKYLDSLFNQWIVMDEEELIKVIPEYDKYEKYYDNQITPEGFKTDAIAVLKENNIDYDKLIVDSENTLFVPVNKLRSIINRMVGEYTSVKKETKVTSANPKNRKAIELARKVIDNAETSQQIWKKVIRPNVFSQALLGEGWAYVNYNSKVDYPLGRIEILKLSPREVLVQKDSKDIYFQDSTRFTRIIRMKLNKAKDFIKRAGGNPDAVGPDSDYGNKDSARQNKEYIEQYVTFHEIFFKEKYTEYYKWDDTQNPNAMFKNADLNDYDLEQEEEYHFRAIYHKTLGVLKYEKNEYNMPWLICFFNETNLSGGRARGDGYFVWKFVALYSVLATLIVDNLRRQHKEIIGISEKIYDEYFDKITEAYNDGGYVPVPEGGTLQNINRKDLSQSIIVVMQLIKDLMEEAGNTTDLAEGDMPNSYLSTKSINNLLSQYRRKFSYKDENIEWAVEQINTLIYRIISKEFTPAHWIKIQDVKPGSPEYVPINQINTLQEYEQYIQEQNINIEQFEQDNDVHYIMPKISLPMEISRQFTLVVINPLDDGLDMTVEVKFDFDAKRDSTEKASRGQLMRTAGLMPDDRYLVDVGGYSETEATEMLKKVYGQNEAMQIGSEITKRGHEFMQMIANMIMQYDVMQQQQKQQPGNGMPPNLNPNQNK